MKRPYIRQKPFWRPRSGRKLPVNSFEGAFLGVEYLNRASCFETMRVYAGKLFHPEAHLERLSASCQAIGHRLPLAAKELGRWAAGAVKESGFSEAILRLSVHWEGSGDGRLVAIAREFRPYPRSLYEKGVELKTAVGRRWTLRAQDPGLKASQYVGGVLAVIDRGRGSAHELLFLGGGGTVAEGAVSNVFLVRQKRILTPSASSGILKGVTRSLVLRLAEKRGIEITQTFLTRHDFYTADECFMTNTSSEILPVTRIDGRRIGSGVPGPVTKMLAKEFKRAYV